MSETPNPNEKQVIVAEPEGIGFSFRRLIAGLICAAFFGFIGYAWQESIALGILAGIIAFVIGYVTGRFYY